MVEWRHIVHGIEDNVEFAPGEYIDNALTPKRARFIAAANPEAVLKLIAALRERDARLERAECNAELRREQIRERDARITDLDERKDFFKKSAVAADDMLIQRDAEIERLKVNEDLLRRGQRVNELGLCAKIDALRDQLRIARDALAAIKRAVGSSTEAWLIADTALEKIGLGREKK